MKPALYSLNFQIWLAAPIDVIWAFGSDPQNLAKLSPPHLKVSIDSSAQTKEGAEFLIRVKPYSLPIGIKWYSRILEVIPNGERRQFCDLQIKGPFAYWKHQHIFESALDKSGQALGTLVIDKVEYAMPQIPLSGLAQKLVVKGQLDQMFRYRQEKYLEMFGNT